MVAGLVQAAGQVRGERLLVAAAGVLVELAAGHGQAGRAERQQLRTVSELRTLCRTRHDYKISFIIIKIS